MPAAGILDWKRSKYQRPILHNSKSPETPRKSFLELIKNTGRRKYHRGPPASHKVGGCAPVHVGPLVGFRCPSLAIWCVLTGKKSEGSFRTKCRRLEAEPGQNQSRAPTELFFRENIPPGGGNHRHRHHHLSSHREGVNIHQHLHRHHLLSNPSSSLVFDLGPKTVDWYLWVDSGIDYSLQLMLVVYSVEDHMFRSLMIINTPLIMNMNMLREQLRLFLRTWEKYYYK